MAENFKAAQPKGSTGKRLTILRIDGGGVRGIIPAVQLTELEKQLKVKPILKKMNPSLHDPHPAADHEKNAQY
jgi:hypothetical protein